jgi:hypothetical protein
MPTTRKAKPNPLRTDPTMLAGQRRRLLAEFRRRLARLRADLRGLIVADDAFGLRPGPPGLDASWYHRDAAGKLDSFATWLGERLAFYFLRGDWWEPHVRDAFTRGASRVYDDVRRAALRDPATHAGGKAEFVRSLLARQTPWAGVTVNALGPLERLGLLFGQFAVALRSLVAFVAGRASQAMPALLAAAASPEKVYRAVTKEVAAAGSRVASVVTTELTRGYAAGALAGMGALGIVRTQARVEWRTASNPCPLCAAMAGRTFTLEQAEGMIPRHVGCRCAWQVVRG